MPFFGKNLIGNINEELRSRASQSVCLSPRPGRRLWHDQTQTESRASRSNDKSTAKPMAAAAL